MKIARFFGCIGILAVAIGSIAPATAEGWGYPSGNAVLGTSTYPVVAGPIHGSNYPVSYIPNYTAVVYATMPPPPPRPAPSSGFSVAPVYLIQ